MKKMKKLLLIAAIVSGIIILTSFKSNDLNLKEIVKETFQSDYCDGWDDGYCEGWKDVKGQFTICPTTPICPIPEIGKDTYKDGYNRGFKKGMGDAKK